MLAFGARRCGARDNPMGDGTPMIRILMAIVALNVGSAYARDLVTNIKPSLGFTKREMIEISKAAFSSCPCPYSVADDGSECADRSAYKLTSGKGPLCYAKDVTPQMAADWYAQTR